MTATNTDIARLFREMADLLEIQGHTNPYRIRAYRNAANTIENHHQSMASLVQRDEDLTDLPNIGEDLAKAILLIIDTGTFPDLEALRGGEETTLTELLQIPGLGPKRVSQLHEELGIETIEELADAIESGKLEGISGFGPKTIETLRENVQTGRRKKERRLRASVEEIAADLEQFIVNIPDVDQAMIGGSYRRQRATVADLDAFASSDNPEAVINRFVEYPAIRRVISHGSTRASVIVDDDLNVDLRVVKPESYGAAAIYFTGNKEHQIRLRDMAIDRGWKLNEYGLFDGDQRLAGATEAEVYAQFDLPYFEPELRLDRGEFDAARNDQLPNLIILQNIRGDLHTHTTDSDGKATIEQMARAARELGHEYLAITDHSSYGRDPNTSLAESLASQAEEIERLNQELDGITILKGLEVDLDPEGNLTVPEDLLADLDIVICAIHDHFDLNRADQTQRLLNAIHNPYCQIIAHPTGRIVPHAQLGESPVGKPSNQSGETNGVAGDPEPSTDSDVPVKTAQEVQDSAANPTGTPRVYEIDLQPILEAAAETGTILELNANPERLDLPDRACQLARQAGIKLAINSDAHTTAELSNLRHGIAQARRGWLEPSNVLNTLPLPDLLKTLRSKRQPS